MKDKIIESANKLRQCSKLVIGAGAGMGKDSGLPDYRGKDGFWNSYPHFKGKFNFYECANPEFLRDHPHLFWGFYGTRFKLYRQTIPHHGFNILSKLSEKMEDRFILTSNVDGHFQQVFPEQYIYEVHGSIHHLQCYFCDSIYKNQFFPEINKQEMSCSNLPKCPTCDNIVRPNILMFYDWEWLSFRSDEQQKRYKKFTKNVKENDKIAIIEIGCGEAIPTIRNMCERLYYAHKNSIYVRINPEQDYSSAYKDKDRFFYIKSNALQALKEIGKESFEII